LFKLLDTKIEVTSPAIAKEPRGPGRIEFDHVWFAYGNKPAAEEPADSSSRLNGGGARPHTKLATGLGAADVSFVLEPARYRRRRAYGRAKYADLAAERSTTCSEERFASTASISRRWSSTIARALRSCLAGSISVQRQVAATSGWGRRAFRTRTWSRRPEDVNLATLYEPARRIPRRRARARFTLSTGRRADFVGSSAGAPIRRY